MIYHVVSYTDWQAALNEGVYKPASLATEGFIHLSKKEQVDGVLQRYYAGRKDLLLLHVDETRLTEPLLYELSPTTRESFPHVFGPINLDAVVAVIVINQV